MPEHNLETESSAFEALHDDLRRDLGPDEWVVVSGGRLQGHFSEFRDAARFVAATLGDAPALVRQVDSGPLRVPYISMRT